MAHQRALPQSKEALLKSYTSRMKDDVKSMLENFEDYKEVWRAYVQDIYSGWQPVDELWERAHINCARMIDHIVNPKEIKKIVKLAKGENETQLNRFTQCEQDTYEMHVRAANMVRAGESLMKLVSDIKQYLILNDFPSVNEAIAQNSKLMRTKQAECDQKLMNLRDDMAADLYDLEEEYYNSIYKG